MTKNNKKVLDRLLGAFIERNIFDSIEKDDIKLIIKYLEADLSVEEKDIFEKRLMDDDDFKFLFDVTKFESSRKRSKNILFYYLLKLKHYYRLKKTKVLESSETVGAGLPILVPKISSKIVLSYISPILTISMVLIFFLQIQPYSYNFNQYDFNKEILSKKDLIRGVEEEESFNNDSLRIAFANDSIKLSWVNNSPFILVNAIILNEATYFTKDEFIEVPFLMQKKPLKRIIEYINPSKKLNDKLKVWSYNDSLEIEKIAFTSIKALPFENKLDSSLTDYKTIGTPLSVKTFNFLITK
jgi:hypothetical protein